MSFLKKTTRGAKTNFSKSYGRKRKPHFSKDEKIGFSDISYFLEAALNVFEAPTPSSIEDVLEVDTAARQCVREILMKSQRAEHGLAN